MLSYTIVSDSWHYFPSKISISTTKFSRNLNHNYDNKFTSKLHQTFNENEYKFISHSNWFDLKQYTSVATKTAAILLVSTLPTYAIDIIYPECSESISVLKTRDNSKEVVLIGTAHISEDSANQVRRTIQKIHPSTVMIELDVNRLGLINNNPKTATQAGFDIPKPIIPENKPKKLSFFESIGNSVNQQVSKGGGFLLGKSIGKFYESTEKRGFKAGGEFQAAVDEGKKINARILLGDRDINVTLQRIARAITTTDIDKFNDLSQKLVDIESNAGLDVQALKSENQASLTQFVENLKNRELLNKVMAIVKENVPDVYNALIGERDEFMAAAIDQSNSERVVAVVGMAHMTGIENNLIEKDHYQLVKLPCLNK